MNRQDVKYRNKVLQSQSAKQVKKIRSLIQVRLNNGIRAGLRGMDNVSELEVIGLIQNLLTEDTDREIIALRRRSRKSKTYAIKVLKELKRLKNKYGEKK